MSVSPAARIAVVGAASLIGTALVEALLADEVLASELVALDVDRDAGKRIESGARTASIGSVGHFDFSRTDVCIFVGRAALAAEQLPRALEHATVIDGTSFSRQLPEVPLIVADVNGERLLSLPARARVALPCSAAAALATALAPLDRLAKLIRADVATYQSVSGSGRAGVDELATQSASVLNGRGARARVFAQQIAFNVMPQVDALLESGATAEELRISVETARVLGSEPELLNVTAVRVPVFFGHAFAVHAAFARPIDVAAAQTALAAAPGVSLRQQRQAAWPTPVGLADAAERVFIGRLRVDSTRARALNLWVVADNIRKCAAGNAFLAAQILVNRKV